MRILRQSPLEENNNEEMLTNRKGYDFPMRTHSRIHAHSVHSVSRVAGIEKGLLRARRVSL